VIRGLMRRPRRPKEQAKAKAARIPSSIDSGLGEYFPPLLQPSEVLSFGRQKKGPRDSQSA
jgi:hypothetical protein